MKKQIYTHVEKIGPDSDEYNFSAIINDNNIEESFRNKVEERSDNRAIILGLTQMLKDFHENQELEIYTQTNFGFKRLEKLKKWVNLDVGKQLANIINEKKLNISFYDYSNSDLPELKGIKQKMKYGVHNIITDTENLPEGVSIIISAKNPSTEKKPAVSIYVRGECESIKRNKPGKYTVLIKGEHREKIICGTAEHTTANRMIIKGLMEALKLMTVPYNIKFYTHTPIGLKKVYKANKGPNADLLIDLINLLEEGGHDLRELIGKDMQDKLRESHKLL